MSLIKKETKAKFNHFSPAFKYFAPELNKEIKVERVFNKTYVANYPDGVERITWSEMKELGWKCIGKWSESNVN